MDYGGVRREWFELLCKELRVEEHERVDDLLAEEQNIQSSAQICFMIGFL